MKKPALRGKINDQTIISRKSQRKNHYFDEKSMNKTIISIKNQRKKTIISTKNQRKNYHFDEKSRKKPPRR